MGRPRAKPGIAAVSSTPIPAAAGEDQPECKNASSQESDPCFHDITPYEHDRLDSASVRYLRLTVNSVGTPSAEGGARHLAGCATDLWGAKRRAALH
jgi:hypothetical protein